LQLDPYPDWHDMVGQAAHEVDPATTVKVPTPQDVHDDAPDVEEVPTGHSEHDVAEPNE
jgi:hypothetical protein